MTASAPAVRARVADILQAACRVVLRDGAHGLRIAEVAREAKVSKPLVLYYFATRQELLRAAFAYSEEQRAAAIRRELERATNGARRVERFLLAFVDPAEPFDGERTLVNEVWSSLHVDEELRPLVHDAYVGWVDEVVQLLEEGRADGSIPRSLDAKSAGWRLAALVDGLDSMLYLGLIDRGRARRIVRQSLGSELST